MRYISLFSGIEAASVAWEQLGWEPVAFAEIEPFPCAVLRKRFPNVPNLGDVSKVDWSPYRGAVDVVVGGSPCQAFSIAGGRGGLLDPRGQLMLEFVRAVREIGPRFVLWENVPGVLSQDGGRAFGTLLRELEDCGLSCAWRVLDAQFVRVPVWGDNGEVAGWVGPVAQRRRRVFLVGHSRVGCAAAVLFESQGVCGDFASSREEREELARRSPTRVGAGGERGGCLTPWDIRPPAIAFQTDHLSQNGTNVSYDVMKTLDTQCPPAVCMSSGQANAEVTDNDCSPTLTTIHEAPIVLDRAAFNQGQNAQFGFRAEESEVMDTLVSRGPNAVCVRRRYVENSNGENVVRCLCASDIHKVNSQIVNDGKIVLERVVADDGQSELDG